MGIPASGDKLEQEQERETGEVAITTNAVFLEVNSA